MTGRSRRSVRLLVAVCAFVVTASCGAGADRSSRAPAAASPGPIDLNFTQEAVGGDLAKQVSPPGGPVASWVDDSTLRVVWPGSPGCLQSPVSFSHDGAGAYSVELQFDSPPQAQACDAMLQVMATTFRNVPRPAVPTYTVALSGALFGQTTTIPVT